MACTYTFRTSQPLTADQLEWLNLQLLENLPSVSDGDLVSEGGTVPDSDFPYNLFRDIPEWFEEIELLEEK